MKKLSEKYRAVGKRAKDAGILGLELEADTIVARIDPKHSFDSYMGGSENVNR